MAGIPPDLASLAVPVASLRPFPGNPRRGDVGAIAESLRVNGQYRPVVVNRRTSEILAGNHTFAAALTLGWDQIAATFVDVDGVQAARIVLADNRTADLGSYDDALLADLLRPLDLEGTGFDQGALDELLASTAVLPEPLVDPDAVPDLPAEPRSKLGDVWLLGPHRLAVGDACDRAVVDRLMAGGLADCVWTDPPYGVDYVGKTADALVIEGDGRDLSALGALLLSALSCARDACLPGAAWYVAAPAGPATLPFVNVLSELECWRQTLAWVKDAFVLGHSDYHYRHEVLYVGYAPGADGRRGRGGEGWYGDHCQDSVLEVPRPRVSKQHPTMKPVALIEKCLANSTTKG